MKKHARFWAYVNGCAVRLSLADGQTIEHFVGGPTDEGWESEATQWSRDGDTITREWCVDGRDCDGRLTSHGTDHCHIDQLSAGDLPYVGDEPDWIRSHWDGVVWPKWGDSVRSQYDEYAEAAGY